MTKKFITPPYIECQDDFRCGQTVILMILKHFMHEKEWTFDDADKICGYIDGKWTWSEAAAVSLAEMGFDVTCFTDFDGHEFIKDPDAYFIKTFGAEKAKVFIDNNDMPFSVELWKRYYACKNIKTISRGWQWQDAKELLEQGYLLMIWVDPYVLYSRPNGNAGHFVVVFDYNEDLQSVMFHDGGSVGKNGRQTNAWKNANIGLDHFMKAAADGEAGGSSLTAFRLQK